MSSKIAGSLIKSVVKKATKRKPYEGHTSKKTRKYTKGGSSVQKPMRDAKSKNQRYQRFGDGEDKEVPIPKKKFTETEGTRRDPEGKGSVDAARDVGTRGEKITRGSKSGANFLTDQSAVGGGRKRAKAKVQLEKLERQNKLTAKEKTQLANMRKADKKAADRQAGKNIKSKLAKSAAQKKVSATKKAEEDLTHFYQTGEMRKGFKPTPQQERQAIKNLKARGMTKQAREIEARKSLVLKNLLGKKIKKAEKVAVQKNLKVDQKSASMVVKL